MKITEEVREYAAAQEVSAEEALAKGMADKSQQFKNQGGEVYGSGL
jgi:phosphomethylpyrimidine synthase